MSLFIIDKQTNNQYIYSSDFCIEKLQKYIHTKLFFHFFSIDPKSFRDFTKDCFQSLFSCTFLCILRHIPGIILKVQTFLSFKTFPLFIKFSSFDHTFNAIQTIQLLCDVSTYNNDNAKTLHHNEISVQEKGRDKKKKKNQFEKD